LFGCINIAQTIGLKKNNLSLFAASGWFILSFILLILPGSSIPKENWLDKIWADKLVHIGIFALLVFLWCRAATGIIIWKEKYSRIFIIITALCTAYGIGMEFVQEYCVRNRSFDIKDMVADSIGAFMGLLYSHRRYIKK
jgi:hypothetical protein